MMWLCVVGACLLWSGAAWAHRDDVVVVKRGRQHCNRDVVVIREPRHSRHDVVIVNPPVRHHRDVIVTSPVVVPSTSVTTFSIGAPVHIGGTTVGVGFSTTRIRNDNVVVGSGGRRR
jgi:hypothetical protein